MNNSNTKRTKCMELELELKEGKIIGTEGKLPNGSSYCAFKGIPYAEPPLGNLRFEAPRPVSKFNESPLDCTMERNICFQKDFMTGENIGSEDSLYLNVYVPKLHETENLPVMVWFHGGSFRFGSGNSDFYSPEYLVQENVIVVTFNYRLSVLGFLYLPEAGIFGNAGLKDQRLVLKWVNEHISAFGGNPHSVTLFGESAGSVSVHIHTLSHQTTKYFQRAILQSGTALVDWIIEKHPEDKTRKLAKLLGCDDTNPHKILEYLRNIDDLPTLFCHYFNLLAPEEKRTAYPIAFKPTIEIESPEAVLTKHPMELMRNTDLPHIQIIMGYNSNEGSLGFSDLQKRNKYAILDKDLDRFIPQSLNIATNDHAKRHQLTKEIRQLYFGGKSLSNQTIREIGHLIADYNFLLKAHLTAELYARYQHKIRIYFYRFDVDRELNMYKQFLLREFNNDEERLQIEGACHGDIVYYLFRLNALGVEPTKYPKALKIMQLMCRLWTNFAKYGEPTPSNQLLPFIWSPVKCCGVGTQYRLDYLAIDQNSVQMKVNPEAERISFWRKQFLEHNGGFLKAKL